MQLNNLIKTNKKKIRVGRGIATGKVTTKVPKEFPSIDKILAHDPTK